jgi:hypothetical protein
MNQIEHPAVIQLLNRNAERSDYRVLKGPLGEAIEPYIYHCMGIDVGRFDLCTRTALLALPTLAVEEFIAIDRLPAWIREGCQHDAYSETRKLVASKA